MGQSMLLQSSSWSPVGTPQRRNVSTSCRCLRKVLRTVSFPILTKLNESEAENAHSYKPLLSGSVA